MAAIGLLVPLSRFIDEDGNPASGWYLGTFITGTDTETPTYSDGDLTVQNENPIELDSSGSATIYVASTPALKLVMYDADMVLQWTVDPVAAAEVAT
jgi:hypothetical protein